MVEPTLAQSRKMFNDFMKAIGDSGVIEKANESLLHIRFINKSEILFKSAEQEDGLREWSHPDLYIIINQQNLKLPSNSESTQLYLFCDP